MPTLTDLPIEILADTLELLSVKDLNRARRVCKALNNGASLVKRLSIEFKIDTPSLTGWKLIRAILADATLGEKIVKVIVRWKRRDPEDRSTWTKVWRWTEEEEKQIKALCKTWGLKPKTRRAILGGINSESLLSLLLCLTPNIKIFKLGKEVPLPMMFDADYSIDRSVVQAFNACLPPDEQGSIGPTMEEYAAKYDMDLSDVENTDSIHCYDDEVQEALKSLMKRHFPSFRWMDEMSLWFDDNLENLGERLPWFSKLENIGDFCGRERCVEGLGVKNVQGWHTFDHFCGKGENDEPLCEARDSQDPLVVSDDEE